MLHCHRRSRNFVRIVIVVAGTGLSFSNPGLAQAANLLSAGVFTIGDVAVDVTAETAAAAREISLADGHVQAFHRLVTRLVPRAERGRVPVPDSKGIAELVQGFEIDDEKGSRVRYLARLTIHFKRAEVRRHLRNARVRFAETPSKPLLVLPIYQRAGAHLLWDNPNPWRAAWRRLPGRDGLVPLIVPAGDLADINDIGAEQAVRGDKERLAAISARYGAGDALLAVARLATDLKTNQPVLSVTVSRLGTGASEQTLVQSFWAQPKGGVEGLLETAAAEVAAEIEESWKMNNLLRFDIEGGLVMTVPLASLGDWIEVRRRLASVAFVKRSDLVSLSRGEAQVRLLYLGDKGQLTLALAQRDLKLYRGPVSWVLQLETRKGAASPAAARR